MKSFPILNHLSKSVFTVLVLTIIAGCSALPIHLPESPFLRNLERKSGKIVLLAPDGNLYTTDQGGVNINPVTTDADGLPSDNATQFYQFPTWSSDGSKLAFVKILSTGEYVEGVSIYTANTDGSSQVEVFTSSEDLPVFLFWSPDDESITYLALNIFTEQLTLNLIPAEGGETQVLGMGSILYWDWHPENGAVAVHTGGDAFIAPEDHLSLVELDGTVSEQDLGLAPSLFKAPAYSPAGDELLLAIQNEDNKNALLLVDDEGEPKDELAVTDGPVAFGWSPDGENIAFIDKKQGFDPFYYGALSVIDKTKPDDVLTVGDAVLGFFWSPDGEKIAYFEPLILTGDYEGSADEVDAAKLRMSILDVSTDQVKNVYEFFPSQSLTNILPSSDQFQHSVSIWSPDSRKLVLSTLGDEGEPLVMVVDASGSLDPRLLAEGIAAYWSWR